MIKKLTYLRSTDNWPYIWDRLISYSRMMGSTFLCKTNALWWGINIKKDCRFWGKTHFKRMPGGTIAIGENCTFRSAFWANTIGLKQNCFLSVSKNAELVVGNNCGFSGTVIAASNSIIIGDRVICGGNCTIVDTDRHSLNAHKRINNQGVVSSPIAIEDDVFLAMNVVVLKGCNIGKGTVVAANSVVAHSLPAGVIAGGVPARVLKEIG